MNLTQWRRPNFGLAVFASVALLSAATVYAQVDALGLHFIRIQQSKAHQEMLEGHAGNPWQYRILPDLMVEPIIHVLARLRFDDPSTLAFISFRYFQCLLILGIAALYYRKLGLAAPASLLGISVLTWSMSLSLYNSDLSFSVFFDVAFYLAAAILILDRRPYWVPLLMVPAALNRETSLLIPVILASACCVGASPGDRRRTTLITAGGSLAIYAIVFWGLRFWYGDQSFLTADGYYPGMQLLLVNLRRPVTWAQLLVTLGIIPVLAMLAYGRWPRLLRAFFWAVVPAWIVVHFTAALVAETRLMLVPQALVFIPAAFLGLDTENGGERPGIDRQDGSQ